MILWQPTSQFKVCGEPEEAGRWLMPQFVVQRLGDILWHGHSVNRKLYPCPRQEADPSFGTNSFCAWPWVIAALMALPNVLQALNHVSLLPN